MVLGVCRRILGNVHNAEYAFPALPHAAVEKASDLETGLAVGDPESGREVLVEALVVGLVAAAVDFLSLLPVELNRLPWAPSWADCGLQSARGRRWLLLSYWNCRLIRIVGAKA